MASLTSRDTEEFTVTDEHRVTTARAREREREREEHEIQREKRHHHIYTHTHRGGRGDCARGVDRLGETARFGLF